MCFLLAVSQHPSGRRENAKGEFSSNYHSLSHFSVYGLLLLQARNILVKRFLCIEKCSKKIHFIFFLLRTFVHLATFSWPAGTFAQECRRYVYSISYWILIHIPIKKACVLNIFIPQNYQQMIFQLISSKHFSHHTNHSLYFLLLVRLSKWL